MADNYIKKIKDADGNDYLIEASKLSDDAEINFEKISVVKDSKELKISVGGIDTPSGTDPVSQKIVGDPSHFGYKDQLKFSENDLNVGALKKWIPEAYSAVTGDTSKTAEEIVAETKTNPLSIGKATGNGAMALMNSYANGKGAFAAGTKAIASGNYSVSTGLKSVAKGANSFAEGLCTVAKEENSHAEGEATFAEGAASHSEGKYAVAKGVASHAGGYNSESRAAFSFSHGVGTISNIQGQAVFGQYNDISPNVYESYFAVGGGTGDSETERKNVFSVSKAGFITVRKLKEDRTDGGYATFYTKKEGNDYHVCMQADGKTYQSVFSENPKNVKLEEIIMGNPNDREFLKLRTDSGIFAKGTGLFPAEIYEMSLDGSGLLFTSSQTVETRGGRTLYKDGGIQYTPDAEAEDKFFYLGNYVAFDHLPRVIDTTNPQDDTLVTKKYVDEHGASEEKIAEVVEQFLSNNDIETTHSFISSQTVVGIGTMKSTVGPGSISVFGPSGPNTTQTCYVGPRGVSADINLVLSARVITLSTQQDTDIGNFEINPAGIKFNDYFEINQYGMIKGRTYFATDLPEANPDTVPTSGPQLTTKAYVDERTSEEQIAPIIETFLQGHDIETSHTITASQDIELIGTMKSIIGPGSITISNSTGPNIAQACQIVPQGLNSVTNLALSAPTINISGYTNLALTAPTIDIFTSNSGNVDFEINSIGIKFSDDFEIDKSGGINGEVSFLTAFPKVTSTAVPTESSQLVTKGYVDSKSLLSEEFELSNEQKDMILSKLGILDKIKNLK